MKNNFKFYFCLLAVSLFVGCNGAEPGLHMPTPEKVVTPSVIANGQAIATNDSGRIDENYTLPDLADVRLETILSQPPPRVRLIFDCDNSYSGCHDGVYGSELPSSTFHDL